MKSTSNIAKNLSALFSSHLINAVQQLALTPLFISIYGVDGFGEWLSLSASVSYLATLDFGLQTFVSQDLTVKYHEGDLALFHIQQSTALRLMLSVVLVGAIAASSAFFLPLFYLLGFRSQAGVSQISPWGVQLTVFVLALQVLISILFGYLTGMFMIVGKAYLGTYWGNVRALSVLVVSIIAVSMHAPFTVVASAQLGALCLCIIGTLIHLRYSASQIFPTLRHWDGAVVRRIARPSGYFALLFSCSFLCYQLPVLILGRLLGPVTVASFSIMRTIFSMARQLLSSMSQAIGPEITHLFARKEWPELRRLYERSERTIFPFIPVVSVGVLAASPLVLQVWVHRPEMFAVSAYSLCAVISAVLATKEHKLQFQISLNAHHEISATMAVSYLLLCIASVPLVRAFHIAGFLVAWLVVELVQLAITISLNYRLFGRSEHLHSQVVWRTVSYSMVGAAGCGFVLHKFLPNRSLPALSAIALVCTIAVIIGDIPVFALMSRASTLRECCRWAKGFTNTRP